MTSCGDGESAADFADRVQIATAAAIGLEASGWGNKHKNAFTRAFFGRAPPVADKLVLGESPHGHTADDVGAGGGGGGALGMGPTNGSMMGLGDRLAHLHGTPTNRTRGDLARP